MTGRTVEVTLSLHRSVVLSSSVIENDSYPSTCSEVCVAFELDRCSLSILKLDCLPDLEVGELPHYYRKSLSFTPTYKPHREVGARWEDTFRAHAVVAGKTYFIGTGSAHLGTDASLCRSGIFRAQPDLFGQSCVFLSISLGIKQRSSVQHDKLTVLIE